jgi:hypothetical protein
MPYGCTMPCQVSQRSLRIIPYKRWSMKLFSREQIQARDIDTLKRQIRQRLGGYTVASMPMTTDNVLFRGVKCDVRPGTVSRISYPPAHCVTENGRFNRAGTSIFYCSRAAPSVLFEIHAKQGDTIALSQWRVTQPIWMRNLGYHPDALHRLGVPIGPRLRLASPISNETKVNNRRRRALSLACTEDVREGEEYRYKLSIAINEWMFYGAEPMPTGYPDGPREGRAAGTVYPAMKLRGVADNAAIWPEFVDLYLRIDLLQWLLVEAANEQCSLYTVKHLATAREFSGGTIVWDEKPMDERLGRGTIALENGRWVSRDGLNNIYEIH